MKFLIENTEAINQMIADYQSGLTLSETAKKYGISISSVLYWMRKKNIPSRSQKGRPFLIRDVEQVVSEYQSCAKMRDIADRHGVHITTIRNLMVRNNIPRRPCGKPSGSGFVDKMDASQYLAHIEKTHPGIGKLLGNHSIAMQVIGAKYGITRERVRQYERRLGLPERLPGRIEAGRLRRELYEVQKRKTKDRRAEKWRSRAEKVALVILAGGTEDEVIAALPWIFNPRKCSKRQLLCNYLSKLRALSGVHIPKPSWMLQGGRPVHTPNGK